MSRVRRQKTLKTDDSTISDIVNDADSDQYEDIGVEITKNY
jgi:hypothetical protein